MPISTILPKGCSSMRGVSSLPRNASGGELVQRANRFYMLSVQRESLHNKKLSLEKRLGPISEQLKRADAELQITQSGCNTAALPKRKSWGNGRDVRMKRKMGRGMDLKY